MGGATEFDGIVLRVFECPILELRVIDEQGGRSFRPTKKEILFLRLLLSSFAYRSLSDVYPPNITICFDSL